MPAAAADANLQKVALARLGYTAANQPSHERLQCFRTKAAKAISFAMQASSTNADTSLFSVSLSHVVQCASPFRQGAGRVSPWQPCPSACISREAKVAALRTVALQTASCR